MMTAVLMIMSVIFAYMAGRAENWSEMRCMLGLWALTFALFIDRL